MSNALKLGSPLKLHNKSVDPSGPEEGLLYYNTADFLAKLYANGSWEKLATKSYADSIAAGFDPKESCVRATTAALPTCTYANGASGVGATLTATVNGLITNQDGGAITVGQRLLVKNQAAALQNGIYVVTAVGDGSNPFVLTRATDLDGSPSNEVNGGEYTFIARGLTQAGSAWVITGLSSAATIGTTALTWTQVQSGTTLQNAYVAGNLITTSASEGAFTIAGTETLQVTTTGGLTVNGGMLQVSGGTAANSAEINNSGIGLQEVTDVTFSAAGTFYDVIGAAKAIQLQGAGGADHYFWFQVTDGANFPQTDPGLLGTGHVVQILDGDSSAQIAAKFEIEVDLVVGVFTSSTSGSVTTVTNVAFGEAVDASATGTAAAVSVTTQGANSRYALQVSTGGGTGDAFYAYANGASASAISGESDSATAATLKLRNTASGAVIQLLGDTSGALDLLVPASFTSYSLTLPSDDGAASQFLQTDGSGVLSWATVAANTLQSAYLADIDGADATITTNATDGAVVIDGDQKLKIMATGGLDMSNRKITTSTTDQSLFFAPNGNGALVAESTTATVGNARGTNAVDLQLFRNNTTEVASGAYATVAGGSANTASGPSATISGGEANIANIDYASVGGGDNNTASGISATVAGGSANTASGTLATISGGESNTASGAHAAIPGGKYNNAAATGVMAMGHGAWSTTSMDLVVGNNSSVSSLPTTDENVHFRIAGNTSDVHIGRLADQALVSGAANKLYFHTVEALNQTKYVTLSAPASGLTSYDLILPVGVGAANTFLKDVLGDGVLSWAGVSLTTDVSGVLPIANGGTNSSTALANNKLMISSGSAIVEHSALTSQWVLFANGSGLPTGSANLTWDGANLMVNGTEELTNGTASSLTEMVNATLADNTSTLVTGFTFDRTVYKGAVINYTIREATTGDTRIGSLFVVSDLNGGESITDTYAETVDVGITWTVANNVDDIEVTAVATSTGNSRVIHAEVTYIS